MKNKHMRKLTKEEKVAIKIARRQRRTEKRRQKDLKYLREAARYNMGFISWGRRRLHGGVFICERRYSDCEARGYCNGDC